MAFAFGKRLFFLGLIASLSATAALAILIVLFAEFDETAGRVLATTALLALYSLFSLPAGVLLDQGHVRALAWTIVGLSASSFALSMVLVWGSWEDGGDERLWKLLATVTAPRAPRPRSAR